MKIPIGVIIAVLFVILGFGLSHSLKGVPEIINLVAMGMALLYLMFVFLKSKKTKMDL